MTTEIPIQPTTDTITGDLGNALQLLVIASRPATSYDLAERELQQAADIQAAISRVRSALWKLQRQAAVDRQ